MREDIADGVYRDDDGDVWVICPDCGNEQADMGARMKCEGCGYAPMPYDPPDAAVRQAAEAVSQTYYEIAAEAIGEDKVKAEFSRRFEERLSKRRLAKRGGE